MIRDRILLVAKLIPFSAGDADDQELLLVAAAKLRLPSARLDIKELLKIRTGTVSGNKAIRAVQADRRRAMKKTAAFWDASALVPLCVREAATRHAQMQLRRFEPVVLVGEPGGNPQRDLPSPS